MFFFFLFTDTLSIHVRTFPRSRSHSKQRCDDARTLQSSHSASAATQSNYAAIQSNLSFTSAANCKAIHPAISCQTPQVNHLNVEIWIPPIFMQAILCSSRRLDQTSMPSHSENSVPFPPYYAAPKPYPSTYVTFSFRHARDSLRYTTPQTLITRVTICLSIVYFLRHNFTQTDTRHYSYSFFILRKICYIRYVITFSELRQNLVQDHYAIITIASEFHATSTHTGYYLFIEVTLLNFRLDLCFHCRQELPYVCHKFTQLCSAHFCLPVLDFSSLPPFLQQLKIWGQAICGEFIKIKHLPSLQFYSLYFTSNHNTMNFKSFSMMMSQTVNFDISFCIIEIFV